VAAQVETLDQDFHAVRHGLDTRVPKADLLMLRDLAAQAAGIVKHARERHPALVADDVWGHVDEVFAAIVDRTMGAVR
jgi:hypothetical protein